MSRRRTSWTKTQWKITLRFLARLPMPSKVKHWIICFSLCRRSRRSGTAGSATRRCRPRRNIELYGSRFATVHVAVIPVALRPFPVADHHVQVSLAVGNDTRSRQRHLGVCAQSKSPGCTEDSHGLPDARSREVEVCIDGANIGHAFPRQKTTLE